MRWGHQVSDRRGACDIWKRWCEIVSKWENKLVRETWLEFGGALNVTWDLWSWFKVRSVTVGVWFHPVPTDNLRLGAESVSSGFNYDSNVLLSWNRREVSGGQAGGWGHVEANELRNCNPCIQDQWVGGAWRIRSGWGCIERIGMIRDWDHRALKTFFNDIRRWLGLEFN